MKAYSIFFLVAFTAFQNALCEEYQMLAESQAIMKCREKTNAPMMAHTKFIRRDPMLDESKEGKCFIHCIMESIGMMKEDGSMDDDKARSDIEKTTIGSHEKVFEAWKTCEAKDQKGTDKCERSFMMFKCFFTERNKLEIEWKTMHKETLDKCREETNLPMESYEKFTRKFELDDSHEMKCYLKCSLMKLGVMNAEGTINRYKSKFAFNRMFEGDINVVDKMWWECQNKGMKDDLCNYAHGVVKCMIEGVKEKKIQPLKKHDH
uniref:Odorant-binding protein 18 n=1 Tax=Tropidothorax elegans TaxID=2233830 RepID=A0A2Z5EM82_9HEMI|nr:odorant-binding protein 18 [Tropidothorax elegans]